MNVFEGICKDRSVYALGATWPCTTTAHEGQSVRYGIRPEHLTIGAQGIPAEIEVVEPMGAETELLVKLHGQSFTVMTHGRASYGPGERVFIAPQAAYAHVFDAASGRRI
jgi:multiple sugar transport system ATP-binding protein